MIVVLSYDVRRRGGIERLTLQVVASLRRQAQAVHLLTPRRLGPGSVGRWLGRARFLLELILWLPRADTVLSMHALLLKPLGWLDGLMRWVPGAHRGPQRLCWLHGIEVWGQALPLVEADLQACRQLIASSGFTRDRVLERAGPWPPIQVVHPMADLVDAREAPEPLPRGLRLLTVARMDAGERYKGHRLVLEALNVLQARQQLSDQLSWRVVGEGNDRAALEALARELGLGPWVVFLGGLEDADLERELRHCSVLLMPSSYSLDPAGQAQGEGFGIVYLEAAQAGRAAIASRLGGQSDLIRDGETGWLIDPDPHALADLLLQLAREPARLGIAGQRARHRAVDHFSAACFDRSLAAAINADRLGEG